MISKIKAIKNINWKMNVFINEQSRMGWTDRCRVGWQLDVVFDVFVRFWSSCRLHYEHSQRTFTTKTRRSFASQSFDVPPNRRGFQTRLRSEDQVGRSEISTWNGSSQLILNLILIVKIEMFRPVLVSSYNFFDNRSPLLSFLFFPPTAIWDSDIETIRCWNIR